MLQSGLQLKNLTCIIALTCSVGLAETAKTHVKIVNRQSSDSAYTYATAYGHSSTTSYGNTDSTSSSGNAAAAEFHVTGATFTLQLPDGRTAVVNCASKFAEHFAGPIGNRRSCRVPLVNEIDVEFHGDSAKLFWPVSIDGKKLQSETYKILAVQ
jgi:hypothetical protein